MAKKSRKRFTEVKGRSSNGKVKTNCAFCKGEGATGTNVYPYNRTCPACKGSGEFLLTKPSIKCVYCGGTGRHRSDTKVTCIVCKGSGANSVKRGYKVCIKCRGMGKVQGSQLACVPCKGAGAA